MIVGQFFFQWGTSMATVLGSFHGHLDGSTDFSEVWKSMKVPESASNGVGTWSGD